MSTESLLEAHNYEDSLHSRKVQGRSSLDTFIIHNRTRLPSSKPKVPHEVNLHLAKTLFDVDKMDKPVEPSPRTPSQGAVAPVAKKSSILNASLNHQQGKTSSVLNESLMEHRRKLSPVNASVTSEQGSTSVLNASLIQQRRKLSPVVASAASEQGSTSVLNASLIQQRRKLSPINASLASEQGSTSVLNPSSIHQRRRLSPVLNASSVTPQQGSTSSVINTTLIEQRRKLSPVLITSANSQQRTSSVINTTLIEQRRKLSPVLIASSVTPHQRTSSVLNTTLIEQRRKLSPVLITSANPEQRTSVLNASLIQQRGKLSPVPNSSIIYQRGRASPGPNASITHEGVETSLVVSASTIQQSRRTSPASNASIIHEGVITSPVASASSINRSGTTSPVLDASIIHQRRSSGSYSCSPTGYDGPLDSTDQSGGTSTTSSTVSDRLFPHMPTGSDRRETSEFIKEYNNLAAKYKLPLFIAQPKTESRVSSAESTKSSVKSSAQSSVVVARKPYWLLRKMLRKNSSSNTVKNKAKAPMLACKSVSIADLRKMARVDLLKDKSLEELVRLGGESILILPTDFAAAQLAVPVGIGAAAEYILEHGRNMPGIFRISGQLSTVNKLYDHYAQQIDVADKDPTAIRPTVTAALLPPHIPHNIHDVAAVFKKFLNALPGGILGSLSLFTALGSIHKEFYANPDATETDRREARARLIALAISSVTSQHRVSLICAVLGLVALIGHESQTAVAINSDSTELMSYRGLGLVFAPLVVGDLTDDIELDPVGGVQLRVLGLPDSPPRTRRPENKRRPSMPPFPGMSSFLDMSGARYKCVAGVFEMLLANWGDVVRQLRGPSVGEERASRLLSAAAAASASSSASPDLVPASARPTAPSTGSLISSPVAAASRRPSLPSAPSLGEQLAEARREAAMWRERAEWAERRLGFRMGVAGGVVPA